MNKKIFRLISKVIDATIPIFMLCMMVATIINLFFDGFDYNYTYAHYYIRKLLIIFVFFVYIVLIVLARIYLKRKQNDFYKLETWIKYDKKRIEIEAQMDALSRQLMNSNVSKYIDINRLVLSGQSQLSGKGLIDYNAFFRQFGLEKGVIELKKNTGAFLTPFNETGNLLYFKCREVLSDIGIFLQRSDNFVEKDDILMNIVSLIVQSEMILVNIDGRNPNVYYELGIAHALGKPTILLSQMEHDFADTGFDIQQKYIIFYKDYTDLKDQLLIKINQIRSR